MGWLGGDSNVPRGPWERGGAAGAPLLPQRGRWCCARCRASLSPELPPSLSPPAPSPFFAPRSPPDKGSAFAGGFPHARCFLQQVFLLMFLGELEKVEHLHSPWAGGCSRQLHPGREQPGSAVESGDPRQRRGHGHTEGQGSHKHQQCRVGSPELRGSPSMTKVSLCRTRRAALSRHDAQCLHLCPGKAFSGKGCEAAPWQPLLPAQNSPPVTSPFSAPGDPFSSPARHRAPCRAPRRPAAATHLSSVGGAEPSLPTAVQPGGHCGPVPCAGTVPCRAGGAGSGAGAGLLPLSQQLHFPSLACRMGCVKSKEAGIQEKMIKTDLDPGPGFQQGHYVKDPTATNRRVSGSRRVSRGRRAEPSRGAQPLSSPELPARSAGLAAGAGSARAPGWGAWPRDGSPVHAGAKHRANLMGVKELWKKGEKNEGVARGQRCWCWAGWCVGWCWRCPSGALLPLPLLLGAGAAVGPRPPWGTSLCHP